MLPRILRFISISAVVISLCRAQFPDERTENCGSLISSVISVCSHPTLSRPDWCCNELKRWNQARCWCEPNAFDALDAVAATGAAYSFRDGFCGQAFQRPTRGNVIQLYSTCDPFDSIHETDMMEQCDNVNPSDLRAQRFASLDVLHTISVQHDNDLSSWFVRMDELFTEDVTMEMVGIFLARGRFEVKQYFMTRQAHYGFMPMTADFSGDHFWRNPRMVSYSGGATTSEGYFNKREFVTFEQCSDRIEAIYTVEDNYQTRYSQLWDASETRLMSRYSQSSAEWCVDVSTRCIGDAYPFDDDGDCQDFHRSQAAAGRVTCNKFEQAYVPQYAIHGDTIACRSFYLDLAVVDPKGACTAVGKSSDQNRCGETQCPGGAFINPFARDPLVPQYESTPIHHCSDTECREDWPSQAQIDSIPENERDRLGQSGSASTRSIPEADTPSSSPIPAELLATDADSLMNTTFENQPVEQQQEDPVNVGSRFRPGSLTV